MLVALLIPWVDAYSVWRGPTKTITQGHPHVFSSLSVAFEVPGGGAARLGLPDVLFFAVFLGASVRFGLRPWWTFVGLLVGLGLTMILATWWTVDGLPALPGISLGFLVPNADLLWRRPTSEAASPCSRSDTDSTCGVCGNMSTGVVRSKPVAVLLDAGASCRRRASSGCTRRRRHAARRARRVA